MRNVSVPLNQTDHEMKRTLALLLTVTGLMTSIHARAQVSYTLNVDSIVGLPDTIVNGSTETFFLTISSSSPLFYQGEFFVELEYGGNFYPTDSTTSANAFIGPNAPNTLQVQHRFSTDDDLSIGDNVVVVWPRIGNGNDPEQEVPEPYTKEITLIEPNSIFEQGQERSLGIYPNPASTYIHFRLPAGVQIASTRLLDLTGREISHSTAPDERLRVADLPRGTYFLYLITSDGSAYSDVLILSD